MKKQSAEEPDKFLQAARSCGTIDEIFNLSAPATLKLYDKYLNFISTKIMRFLGTGIQFVKASGSSLWDEKGCEYHDFFSGFGALNLGHEPPEVLRALRLVENKPNIFQSVPSPFAAKLAELLASVTPGDLCRSFFCSTGAEAVEAALKIARAATGKRVFLSTEGGYHGKTFGALSVSGREKYKKSFLPMVGDTEQIPFDDLKALEARLGRGDVAGFIVEPIQGENGVIIPQAGYLKGAETLCRRYGTLLLADEIQTGFGRTGRLFACEHEGVVPDVLILSKSIGGGVMPLGAIITTDVIWKKAYGTLETGLMHSTTFGANTRACAAGFAAIQSLAERKLIPNAMQVGEYFLAGLKRLQLKYPELLEDVRGRGLMIGLTFVRVKGNRTWVEGALTMWVARQMLKKHRIMVIFTMNNYDVLRIAPPLALTQHQADLFLAAFDDILASLHKIKWLGLITEQPGQNKI